MNLKTCKNCKNELPLEEFYVSYISSKGEKVHKSFCKNCHKTHSKNWIKKHPEQQKQIRERYNSKNVKKIREYSKNYDSKEIQKTFYNKNKHKFFEYKKKRRKEDPIFKLKENIRKRIYDYLKNNKKGKLKYLGCSIEKYKLYLEEQFTKEMNWNNYGIYWEIDHIKPLFSFNLTQEEKLFEAFHYSNTRPLEITLNRSRPKTIKHG
jgi:predicted Fe-S protein YdhL (DUF1289 family)